MKKLLVVAAAFALFASPAAAVILGGPHDLSGLNVGNAGGKTDETCVFCHTPHGASTTTAAVIPLANRAGSGSVFCMSCHDGNVVYGDLTNPANIDTTLGAGTDYNWNDPQTAFGAVYSASNHPVGVAWTAGGVMTATNTLGVASGTNIECTSCHSLHSAVQQSGLLRLDNTDSALCTNCHAK